MFMDESPIAWTALPRDAIVVAADGTEIGRVKYVLGDQQEDIFHGIAMRRADDGATVDVPWSRIKKMTEEHVVTDIGPDEVGSLPAYPDR
jgi:sporulation protein YlmC with PRC-barrel domain